ncbi:hypothetical protein ACQ5SP_08235 [Rhodovulum sp. YNF3179]|uniref:hypothetical protein n=1 Tax=Rhodovulum sp. YNF3179 TaxID=3425127 RepID=UPI003D33E39B
MFDQSSLPPQVADWQATLGRGDIILFRFPIAERSGAGKGPKCRPCLVLDVYTSKGQRFAKLAYGTSATTRANRGYEVHVTQKDALADAGVNKPTRFVCARTIIVSLGNPGFPRIGGNGSPVIGRLNGPLIERMNAVRARLQAEADIAADAREERRKERLQWRREGRGFRERNRALLAARNSDKKKGLAQ